MIWQGGGWWYNTNPNPIIWANSSDRFGPHQWAYPDYLLYIHSKDTKCLRAPWRSPFPQLTWCQETWQPDQNIFFPQTVATYLPRTLPKLSLRNRPTISQFQQPHTSPTPLRSLHTAQAGLNLPSISDLRQFCRFVVGKYVRVVTDSSRCAGCGNKRNCYIATGSPAWWRSIYSNGVHVGLHLILRWKWSKCGMCLKLITPFLSFGSSHSINTL